MKHSEQMDKIAPAMALAQQALKGAKKDSENPFFKSKYADLESVWEACKWAMAENGLSVLQGHGLEPQPHVWTMLLHTSGQWVMGECQMVLSKNDPQGVVAATTYYRRCGLSAIMGIVPEDDDGETAMGRQQAGGPFDKSLGGPDAKKISDSSKNAIKEYMDRGVMTEKRMAEIKALCKVKISAELDEKQAKAIIAECKSLDKEP